MPLNLLIPNAVRLPVPLNAVTLTGSGATNTRDAQGQFSISLPTAGTTYRLGIPLNHMLPWALSSVVGSNPFGFRLDALQLWYSIGAVDLTAHTLTLNTETILGAAARAAATTFGGTLTTATDGAAPGALPTTQRANLYETIATLASPAFITTDNQLVTAEWTLATGAMSGTAKVHGIILRGDFGLHG